MLHGSGPDTRQGYQLYAEYPARRGIAALAYDKRGTGASSGDWRRATFEDLARDALAGLDSLRLHPGIDSETVGLRRNRERYQCQLRRKPKRIAQTRVAVELARIDLIKEARRVQTESVRHPRLP